MKNSTIHTDLIDMSKIWTGPWTALWTGIGGGGGGKVGKISSLILDQEGHVL